MDLIPDTDPLETREWLEALSPPPGCRGVAFDTRVDGPTILTGRAVHEIDKGLARAGALIVAAPESFLVNMDSSLVAGEGDRAGRDARPGGGESGHLQPAALAGQVAEAGHEPGEVDRPELAGVAGHDL